MWPNTMYSEQSHGGGAVVPSPTPTGFTGQGVLDTSGHTPSLMGESALDIPPDLVSRLKLCEFLAGADLLHKALRNSPPNILLIMHKALALGIPLGVALEHMHVIDGKVGHSAELLRALLTRHGHLLRWITISDKEATGELVLRHDPKHPRRGTFTIAQAQAMKLAGKDNWQKDPESMLVARCSTRLVSRHCPEIAVALGNLSDPDLTAQDLPPVQDGADADATEPTLADQAAALHAEARQATTPDEVKALGRRASSTDLLNHVVDGDTTLQQALLWRIQELSTSKDNDDGDAPRSKEPKNRSGR